MASSNNAPPSNSGLASFLAMQNAQRQHSHSPVAHQHQQQHQHQQHQQHQQQIFQSWLIQHQHQQQQMHMRHEGPSPPPPPHGAHASNSMSPALPSLSNLMLNGGSMPHQPQSVHPMSHQRLLDHFTSMARASAGMAPPNSQSPNHLRGINTSTDTNTDAGAAGSQKRARGNSDVHAHGHAIMSNFGMSSNFALQQQLFNQQQQHHHAQLQNGLLPHSHLLHHHHHPGNISTGVANGLRMPVGAKIHKAENLAMYGSPGSAVAAQIAAAVQSRLNADSPAGGGDAASGSSAGGLTDDEESEQVIVGECPPAELREKGRVYTVRGHLKKWDGRRFARCCGANGCTKLAQGPTNYCKGHGGGTRCKSDGCKKAARGGSDSCAVHGGGKRCKNFGCVKAAVGNDFCRRHGGGRRCITPDCPGTARGGATMCSLHGGDSSSASLAKSPIIQPKQINGRHNMSPGGNKDDDARDRSPSETSFNSATSEDAKSAASPKPRRARAKKKKGYSMIDSPNTVSEEFEHPDAISSLLSIGRRLMEHHSKPKHGPCVVEADDGVLPPGVGAGVVGVCLATSSGASKVE